MSLLGHLNDPQMIYLNRISHPHSAEDVLIAMQNTLSPIYRNMMKLIEAGSLIDAIIEVIVNEHLNEVYTMKKYEKLALVDHVLKQAVLNEDILSKICNPIAATNETHKIHNDIVSLRTMVDNLCNRWKHAIERQVVYTANELHKNKLKLIIVCDDGQLKTVSAKEPIALLYIKTMHGSHSLEPVKFFINILQSHYLMHESTREMVNEVKKTKQARQAAHILIPTRNAVKIVYQVDSQLKCAFNYFSDASNNLDYDKLLELLRTNDSANTLIHKSLNEECCKIFDMSYVIAEEIAKKHIAYYTIKKHHIHL